MKISVDFKFIILRFFKEYGLQRFLNEKTIKKFDNPLLLISDLFTWSLTKEGYNFWLEVQIKILYSACRIYPNEKTIKTYLNYFLDDSLYAINDESKEIKRKYRNLYKNYRLYMSYYG